MKQVTASLAMSIINANVQRLVRDHLKGAIVVPKDTDGEDDEELLDAVNELLDRLVVTPHYYGDPESF